MHKQHNPLSSIMMDSQAYSYNNGHRKSSAFAQPLPEYQMNMAPRSLGSPFLPTTTLACDGPLLMNPGLYHDGTNMYAPTMNQQYPRHRAQMQAMCHPHHNNAYRMPQHTPASMSSRNMTPNESCPSDEEDFLGLCASDTANEESSYNSRAKFRRNTKPLDPIDPSKAKDPVEKKRMQNTLAARKTRARREARTMALEAKVTQQNTEIKLLKSFIIKLGIPLPVGIAPLDE